MYNFCANFEISSKLDQYDQYSILATHANKNIKIFYARGKLLQVSEYFCASIYAVYRIR